MKKYNLHNIMTTAWNLFRAFKSVVSFSECLRRAWAIAKSSAVETAKKKFAGYVNLNGFEFSAWEKYGKRRIYIKNFSGHNRQNKGGYIDLDNNRIFATGVVKDAAKSFIAAYVF